MDTRKILLDNLRTLQKLLSPKYKSPHQLTELLIVLAAAEAQAIQLLGDLPHPLLKVLAEAQEMCDPNKIRQHISKQVSAAIMQLS
jgi:hypothetical protein